jgi:hypothetical protein
MPVLIEAHPLIRSELNVKTHDGVQPISGLVDYDAALDFVSEDFARHLSMPTRKSKVKIYFQLASGQRVTSSTVVTSLSSSLVMSSKGLLMWHLAF